MGARRTTYAAALAAFALAIGLAGCGDRKTEETAKPAPDVLAKPPELMKPAGNDTAKDAPRPQAEEAPEAAKDGDDEDIYDDAPPSDDKPRRASAKHEKGRKRASSSPKVEDAPEAPSAEAASPVPLKVKRIQFSETIASREPVDPEETFALGETDKLYAFVELTNETKQKSKIVVRFVPPAGAPTKVTLEVGDKSRWRTWALRRGVKAAGTWTVIVQDAEGKEIGRRSFEVTE